MKFAIAAIIAALASPAAAQQPTPSQIALAIDNVVNGFAQTMERQQKQIADLQAALKASQDKQSKSSAEPSAKPPAYHPLMMPPGIHRTDK